MWPATPGPRRHLPPRRDRTLSARLPDEWVPPTSFLDPRDPPSPPLPVRLVSLVATHPRVSWERFLVLSITASKGVVVHEAARLMVSRKLIFGVRTATKGALLSV